jgi:hypothetical protein
MHYWYRLVTVVDINIGGLTANTNIILLVAVVLRKLIPKIGVIFGIGLLSELTPIL